VYLLEPAMNGIIATLRVKPDRIEAFEARFDRLAIDVEANEPGNHLYQLCKSKTEAGVYKVMEIYEDQAAQDAHMAAPYFKAAGKDFKEMLSAPLEIYEVETVD
jgi:quinol monooxygenase YgiN